jgi:hypothetical protein
VGRTKPVGDIRWGIVPAGKEDAELSRRPHLTNVGWHSEVQGPSRDMDGATMTLPTPDLQRISFLIGMPRAGTTFLYHNLQKHPQIYVPFRRKTNFFSIHSNEDASWFLDHFKGIKRAQIGIDTETLYYVDREMRSLERIRALNPDAKAILFVRRPGDWAVSLYNQISTFDRNAPPFEKFLKGSYMLIEDEKRIPFNMREGDIQANIERARSVFAGNLLIINFDLLERSPLAVLQQIETFLGLDHYFATGNFDEIKINAADRGHIKWLARLLRNRLLIDVLRRLPRRVVIFFRRLYDSGSAFTGGREERKTAGSSANLALAARFYAADELYVGNLFKDSDVRHG